MAGRLLAQTGLHRLRGASPMFADGAPVVMINGESVDCVSGRDRGLLYGDGVFETLFAVAGQPRFWRRHMRRLLAGCRRLAIHGVDPDVLHREAAMLLAGQDRCVLKIIITRGPGGRGYGPAGSGPSTRILQRHPAPDYPDALPREGVRVRLCQARLSQNPQLAGIKHLNRLEQVLARSEWTDPEIHEGLVRDVEGRVVEGTMSNVFLWMHDRLVTPELSRCGVAGIMRSVILELAAQEGVPVSRAAIDPGELEQATEVFLTNTLIGIWPVRHMDGRDFPVGPVTRQLQAALAGLADEGSAWQCDELQEGVND